MNSGMFAGAPISIDSNSAIAMANAGAIKKSTNTYLSFNLLF